MGACGMEQGPRSRAVTKCVPCASPSRVMLSGGAGGLATTQLIPLVTKVGSPNSWKVQASLLF